MTTEVAARAAFAQIRYAQCWEDADILVDALQPAPGRVFVSIASAGDNSLALLARDPARVVALDLNPAQLACVELRVAAYRRLAHPELLQLIGSREADSARRVALYAQCRPDLGDAARAFWDARREAIAGGIGAAGKFENYFRLFRRRVLPFVHSRRTIAALLAGGSLKERRRFYARDWDTWRWRVLFHFFFSRRVMGLLGRDPEFFRYVEGSVADRILARTRYALAELDPAANPYLHWILTGRHGAALPFALREENFEPICRNLDRFECRLETVEEFLARADTPAADGFNLSDIFEYMSPENHERLLRAILAKARPGARLAYWNMLAPRERPESLADRLVPQRDLAAALFARDKAWFYSRFIVEEVRG